MIENLNKAYYPSKTRKSKKGDRSKQKSSTPNVKVRKYQKEFIPILKQHSAITSTEQNEIDLMRQHRQREEQEILERQRNNIEQLKQLQNKDYSIVQEKIEESFDEVTVVADNSRVYQELNETSQPQQTVEDVYLYNMSTEIDHNQTQFQGAVEINDSDDNEDDPNGPDDDNDPVHQSAEKALVEKRSRSDQLEELPSNVIIANSNEPASTKPSKKKGKQRQVPKSITRVVPNCTDSGAWRKKNRLEKKTKIFKMIGNYASIKKALYERGWVENKDKSSPCFDLMWTLRQRDIDYENLREGQIVNHFRYNGVITTKVGLCRNISNVINFNNVDYDTFFPKCYALKDEGEWEDF